MTDVVPGLALASRRVRLPEQPGVRPQLENSAYEIAAEAGSKSRNTAQLDP